jgi:NADH-quinone oxidoreductase subunit G
MTQHELVSPHDGIGSNLYGHVLRGQLMRVVPRPNEAINETWIADRDRFSYEGVYASDRLLAPMLRRAGQWQQVSWEEALTAAAGGLKDLVARDGAGSLGVIGTPGATLEELYLLARVARGLGCANVDTRLRQLDFRGQQADPVVPGLGMAIADVDGLDALLVVGSHLRHEAPILAHRVRKAATRNRARVSIVNPTKLEWLFPVAHEIACRGEGLQGEIAALLKAAAEATGQSLPASVAALAAAAVPSAAHRDIVAALAGEGRRAILLGALAMRHPGWADLRDAAAVLAQLTGATLSLLPEGANAAGAALAGALPHRGPCGESVAPGLDLGAMLARPLPAYLLFGGVEPEADTLVPAALEALGGARLVVAMTPYASATLKSYAHVLLPIGTFAETSGTYVNVEGRWQSFAGCIRPLGEARPGWKVLRVLGTLLGLDGFDYDSSEQVREELRGRAGAAPAPAPAREVGSGPRGPVVDLPLYSVDAIVRRAPALQQTRDGRQPVAQV